MISFVVSRCDPSVLLEIAKEVFDEVAPTIHREIACDGGPAIGLGRDHGDRAAFVELLAEPIVVKALVADQRVDLDPVEQRRGANAVMPLSGQQHEAGKVAKSVDQGDDLGRQAAARAADGLILSPPFAPVPC